MQDPFHQASGALVSYWGFYTIQAAIELKVFDALPGSLEALQEKTELPLSSLKRLLRALQELELVEEDPQWAPTDKGAFFKGDHPFSLKGAANLWKKEHMDSWKELSYSLKTGQPAFDKKYGAPWFDWLKENPKEDHLYHKALAVYAERDYAEISDRIDLHGHRSILDVGGGKGILLSHLLEKHPHLTGILFDLPNVLKQVTIPPSLKSRMECIPGDFFQPWPPLSVESIILSRVLHDWGDEEAIEILKNVRSVLSNNPNNRVYIVENVLDESKSSGGLLDLNMLVMTGGAERTAAQFEKLFKQGGLTLEKIQPLNEVSSILIAFNPKTV